MYILALVNTLFFPRIFFWNKMNPWLRRWSSSDTGPWLPSAKYQRAKNPKKWNFCMVTYLINIIKLNFFNWWNKTVAHYSLLSNEHAFDINITLLCEKLSVSLWCVHKIYTRQSLLQLFLHVLSSFLYLDLLQDYIPSSICYAEVSVDCLSALFSSLVSGKSPSECRFASPEEAFPLHGATSGQTLRETVCQ